MRCNVGTGAVLEEKGNWGLEKLADECNPSKNSETVLKRCT